MLIYFYNILLLFPYLCISVLSKYENPLMEGVIQLNGRPYRAMCHCSSELNELEKKFMEDAPICNPSKVKINEDHAGSSGLTIGQVRASYGQPVDVTFGKVSQRFLSCTDGRVSEPSLSVPGGDLGEFLLMIAVGGGEKSLSPGKISDLLNSYLISIPAGRMFYSCTDDTALEHLEKVLGVEGLNLINPGKDQYDKILSNLSDFHNTGDNHYKSLLKNPDAYGIDKDLPGNVLRAFYKILWDRENPNSKKLILDILPNEHNPEAYLEVAVSKDCQRAGVEPLLRPKNDGHQAAIWNVTASQNRREEGLKFLKAQGLMSNISIEELLSRINKHGTMWASVSSKYMVPDGNYYRLVYI